MREEIVKFENDILIHISGATPPELDSQIPIEKKDRLISTLHLHNEYEFLKINRGSFRCYTVDKEFILEEGDIMFLDKYIPHSTYAESTHSHHSLIQFRMPSDRDSITQYISRFTNISDTSAYAFKKDAPESAEIISCVNAILNEYNGQKPFWKDYVYNHTLMLITALRRQGILSGIIEKKLEEINRLRPVLEYINEHYAEEISTLDLSRIMSFNETYFCRMFKSIVGTSAVNYINFVRICKAEMLLEKNLRLLDIATQCGFSSLSYFNRVFKKYTHYSPRDYRKITFDA